MESNQTAQMVAWLDEERRKDKALITKIEERTTAQAALLQDQARRIQALEGELAALRAAMLTTGLFDEAMARLRSELMAAIKQADSRRSTIDQDIKKLLEMDREATSKVIDDLRREFSARIEQALEPRRAEEERLARVAAELQAYADNLGRGLEEFERSLTFLEEQRRHDSRRLSDLNSEIIELSKRVEVLQAKLELIEELSRRNERALEEVPGALLELRQQQQAWTEQEALAAQQRERTLNEMIRRLEGFAGDMATYGKQVESWSEISRTMKKQIEDFDRLADRVDRRLNEVAEVQRLSEERFRHEWEEFLQDDQKRWRQFTLTNEENWRLNEKAMEELRGQLARFNDRLERVTDHVKHVTTVQQNLLNLLSGGIESLREQSEDSAKTLQPLK